MKKIVMMTAITVLCCSFNLHAASRVLANNGKSDYAIRLCAEPTPAERHAAKELQRFFKEITGAELPVREAGALPEHAILVGRDAEAERLVPGVDWAKLGDEGLVVRTAGPHLLLAGGRPRGTLYAVYSFLEDELGCRWFFERNLRCSGTFTSAPSSSASIPAI